MLYTAPEIQVPCSEQYLVVFTHVVDYVDCEACIRLTIYIVQFQLIRETSRQQRG